MLRTKCELCEKKSILNNTIQCRMCDKNICSRHSKEQYKRYALYGFLDNSYVSYNYPNGDSFNKKKFICYNCRTYKISNNIRDKGFSFDDLIFRDKNKNVFTYGRLISLSCTIIAIGLFILGMILMEIYGNETICILSVLVIPILILFSIIIAIYWRKKMKKWWDEVEKE